MSFKTIGQYLKIVDNRNYDLSVTNLLGINITKNFMPSVANVSGTDLSNYKVDFFHNPSNNPKTTIKINQSTDQIKA